jgi:hypothetical protein
MSPVLTPGILFQIRGLELFKEEFLARLLPGGLNPFTPSFMDYLRGELNRGDEILFDTGIHTIFGDNCPDIEVVIQELQLLAPILPF